MYKVRWLIVEEEDVYYELYKVRWLMIEEEGIAIRCMK
jgi:hypothetical protein